MKKGCILILLGKGSIRGWRLKFIIHIYSEKIIRQSSFPYHLQSWLPTTSIRIWRDCVNWHSLMWPFCFWDFSRGHSCWTQSWMIWASQGLSSPEVFWEAEKCEWTQGTDKSDLVKSCLLVGIASFIGFVIKTQHTISSKLFIRNF